MLAEILAYLSVFQHPYLGSCPENLRFQTYNGSELDGRWYEHSRYPNFLQESNRCASVDVKRQTHIYRGFDYLSVNVTIMDAFGNKVLVRENDHIYKDFLPYYLMEWSVDPLSPPYRFLEEIMDFPGFTVLSTDYTNYVIVSNCYEFHDLPLHFRLVWILTRERKPSDETLQVAHNILTENDLSVDRLIKTDQDDCD